MTTVAFELMAGTDMFVKNAGKRRNKRIAELQIQISLKFHYQIFMVT